MQSDFNRGLKNISNKYPAYKSFFSLKSVLPSLPYAYGLPKIHKPNCRLRPIISFVNSPYKLTKNLVSHLSQCLESFSSSHFRHSGDLLFKLKALPISSSNKFILFDVISLFTNVPLDPTLEFSEKDALYYSFLAYFD